MPPRAPIPSPSLLRHLRSLAHPSPSPSPLRPRCIQTRPHQSHRCLSSSSPRTSPPTTKNRFAPQTHDRGPKSTEDTQTDFSAMDIFNTSATPTPATSIDACTSDSFHLNNGVKTTRGKGVLLVGGECFTFDLHDDKGAGRNARLDERGVLSIDESAFSVLELLHPKPDLLILGTGPKLCMLSKKTREYLGKTLGVRVDVMDTGNASAAYNLLAQERGVEGGGGVGAALLPLGWGEKGWSNI